MRKPVLSRKTMPFKEKNNLAKLDRIPPGFSHKEHVEKIERSLGCINDYLHKGIHRDLETDFRYKYTDCPDVKEFLRKAEWERQKGG